MNKLILAVLLFAPLAVQAVPLALERPTQEDVIDKCHIIAAVAGIAQANYQHENTDSSVKLMDGKRFGITDEYQKVYAHYLNAAYATRKKKTAIEKSTHSAASAISAYKSCLKEAQKFVAQGEIK